MINQTDDGKIRLRRICTKAIWPTAPRDFLICTTYIELDDGSILLFSRSAPDTLYSQQKGYVRGFFNISGYWIQQQEESSSSSGSSGSSSGSSSSSSSSSSTCKVTLTSHLDLGGNVPPSLINAFAVAAPFKMITAMKEIVSKKSACSSPAHKKK